MADPNYRRRTRKEVLADKKASPEGQAKEAKRRAQIEEATAQARNRRDTPGEWHRIIAALEARIQAIQDNPYPGAHAHNMDPEPAPVHPGPDLRWQRWARSRF